MLDPGSDDTVFEAALAAQIGIGLSHAPFGEMNAAGGVPVRVRYATVTFRL